MSEREHRQATVDGDEARDAPGHRHIDELARAHAALAAAQDRTYWLDRWGVDLNELMRRRGASELRAAVRAVRGVKRLAIKVRRQAKAKVDDAKGQLAEERGDLQPPDRPMPTTAFQRAISPKPLATSPVTDLLFNRLDDSDLQEIRSRLDAGEIAVVDAAEAVNRKRILMSLGVYHEVESVRERTGMTSAMPPAEVHAMSRGQLAAGGAVYYADLIVDGLRSAGMELSPGMRCLDFGCSSGRVVRALAAAYPDCDWRGCDPIVSAIDWARDNLPGIEFSHSPDHPPLPYGDGELDMAFAISIWSHFAEQDAIAWLAEMQRIIRPGGMLLITTHGLQTIAHDGGLGLRLASQLDEVKTALYEDSFWFKNEFGEGGDYGVDHAGWGTAFLTPEWLLTTVAGNWRVSAFAPGRVEDNQDMYVLERR